MPTKTTRRAVLDSDQDFMLCGEPRDQIGVERLCEPRIGNGKSM